MSINKERDELQKEIVDSSPLQPHGRYLLAPRLGKTKIAIDLIKINNPKTILWVTPLAELAEVEIPKEFKNFKATKFIKKLETSTWASLNKVTGYKTMIILDEEQHATENNLSTLFSGELTADYIITLTGTETRSEAKQQLYDRLELPVIYDFNINEAVDANILADYVINVVHIPLGITQDIQAGNAKNRFFTTEEKQYFYLNKEANKAIFSKNSGMMFKILARMRAIYNSTSKFKVAQHLMNTLNGRILSFSPSIKAAEELHSNTYHSKTDNTFLRQFIEEKTDRLSLVNAGGTGVTYKNIDHLIITQADKDENGLTSQKITRTLLQQGEDYKATIWILCLLGTQDEKWVESTLQRFDPTKVVFLKADRNFKITTNADKPGD